MVEEADDAATIPHRSDGITSRQYIVYSPTFQVPVLYFTVHDSHGTPLCLGDLIQTSLFKPDSLPPSEITSFGLSPESSPFPMLSQGDHPTLGTPCWYLHPCETPKAVGEIMAEIQRPEWTQAEYLTQWLRTWFAVLSGVVDLRP
ncbi:hypothetical protein GLOTRDRAFT_70600 [Gloeophyllum trabeum ATCC 11539]|uniref:Ubiquitin-like-conjugating enzyme ATG10 n=1 Tax=Gloeophyllum trabeum (strain ATCC 11539 / FP-39264 / Madison 617) TaxID=670483 RepID=S7QIX3_GLOTA|nr:uncharacterized protein GLOTRDRAFT_70600 [Gloeophyllum trabeum ATCC 11539]EPQ59293.1 hypothetical protein GLOTRDRAFT_70600 [Gloeophyllum trabeum ATCC 11539]